jgi:hypothetical protein
MGRALGLSARKCLQLGAIWIMAVAAFLAVVASSGCGGGDGGEAAIREAERLASTHPGEVTSTQELAALIESIASKCAKSGDDHPWRASEVADSIEDIMRARHEWDVMEAARSFDSLVPEDPAATCDIFLSLITG